MFNTRIYVLLVGSVTTICRIPTQGERPRHSTASQRQIFASALLRQLVDRPLHVCSLQAATRVAVAHIFGGEAAALSVFCHLNGVRPFAQALPHLHRAAAGY